MKVVLLTPYWLATKGGISTYVYNLAEELKRVPGIDVRVITRDDGSQATKIDGNKICCLIRLPMILRESNPDVIHCHGLEVLLIGALIYKMLFNRSVKIVYTFHTEPPLLEMTKFLNKGKKKSRAWLKTKIFGWALKKCNLITCVSRTLGEEIRAIYNLSIQNCIVTVPGVRKRRVDYEEKKAFLEDHKLLGASPIICTISILAWALKVKGIEILIRAFREIVSQYPQGRLLIVGDGPHKNTLRTLTENLKLENSVTFCGYMDNPFVALSISDIYCHISLQEALGHAILEAMICGKPVVAARIGGIPEIIRSGENGVLVEPNEDSVSEGLLYLIRNPVVAQRLGINAETIARQKFLWPDIARKISTLYKSA